MALLAEMPSSVFSLGDAGLTMPRRRGQRKQEGKLVRLPYRLWLTPAAPR